jgi:hypothetical protein
MGGHQKNIEKEQQTKKKTKAIMSGTPQERRCTKKHQNKATCQTHREQAKKQYPLSSGIKNIEKKQKTKNSKKKKNAIVAGTPRWWGKGEGNCTDQWGYWAMRLSCTDQCTI